MAMAAAAAAAAVVAAPKEAARAAAAAVAVDRPDAAQPTCVGPPSMGSYLRDAIVVGRWRRTPLFDVFDAL